MAVLECKNLKKTDTFGSTDGYVEVSLLPHKEKMDKTKTIKSSANPVWNQTFTYQVNIAHIVERVVGWRFFWEYLLHCSVFC